MSKKIKEEPTIQEVLTAIGDYATNTDRQIAGVKEEIAGVREEVGGLKEEMAGVKMRLTKVEATMVTKDYLDTKLADLRGDLVVLTRKEDVKLKTVVEILLEKKIFTAKDVKKIMAMEPFPQLAL